MREFHHIHIHRYGDYVEVTLYIRLPSATSLKDAHTVAMRMEEELRVRYG